MARIAAAACLGPEFEMDFDAAFVRSSDRISQITLLGARKALGERRDESIGFVHGLDYGVYPTVAACLHRTATEGYRSTSPQEFALATPNIAHSLTCIQLGLKGPNTNVSCGSLSSLVAIGLASELIDWGRADTLLAGGSTCLEEPIPELASAFGAERPSERSAFVLLEREGDVEITGFRQKRLRNGSMAELLRETLEGKSVDAAIVQPGGFDGLPDVPRHEMPNALDASGAAAVVDAVERIRQGASSILVAQRDLGGHDGAALVLSRIG